MGRQIAKSQNIPAPVKGWWIRDSIMDAPADTAIIFKNVYSEGDKVRIRRGSSSHGTTLGASAISSLMEYVSGSTRKLFCAAETKIFDVTNAGAGVSEVTGLTSGQWQSTMISTAAGQFLWIANGNDAPRYYDGAAWTALTLGTLTGISDITKVVQPFIHKERLWVVERGTTDLWYLAPQSIAGALTKLPIGSYLKRGGYILACGTWSSDTGSGLDDRLVVVSSNGEMLIFAGSDPASDWTLAGIYPIPLPIGRRCLVEMGSELLIITEEGLLPVSKATAIERSNIGDYVLSRNISRAWREAVQNARDVFGWEGKVFSSRNMLVLNIPGANAIPTQQFVYNTSNKAWHLFVGWDAYTFIASGGDLYFGTDNFVVQAETGGNDQGAPISVAMLPAYTALGYKGNIKEITLIRPFIDTDLPDIEPTITIAVDFEEPTDGASSTSSGDTSWARWDSTTWDSTTEFWFGYQISANWTSASGGVGTYISPYTVMDIESSTATSDFRYNFIGFQMLYKLGAPV